MTFASSRSTGAGLAFRKSVIRYQRKSSGRVLNGRFVKCTSTTGHSGIGPAVDVRPPPSVGLLCTLSVIMSVFAPA